MTEHRRGIIMTPKLQKVVERAKREPNARFNSLAYLIDKDALERAYRRLRTGAAAGVDGITKAEYAQGLEGKLRALCERMKSGEYRHQPIRRVNIPKGKGETRPIGLSTIEDKIVQGAICEVLGAIYEQDFMSSSYGFRPGRGCHDALRMLDQMVFRERIEWIVEADIQSFFDNINRSKLEEMLRIRVADGSMRRLVGKCLRVGVLDGARFWSPDEGTAQGSIISPLLGNVYLHYALDNWFESVVRPRLVGHARLIRYADDFVLGFHRKDDAERVLAVLYQRMARFGLTLHPEKTRLVRFGRPPRTSEQAQRDTFDFLGFTLCWQRSRKGSWVLNMKTRKASFRKAIKALSEWCRRHRHLSLAEQHAALTRRLLGHYNYFGVNGNLHSLSRLRYQLTRVWFKWLKRRSQQRRRGTLTWERFEKYLERYPFPEPRIKVQIWAS